MINLDVEKSHAEILSSQDRYDIITFAMEAADDNGFINSFIFERALYVYAAIMLYQERKEELASLAAEDLLNAWQTIVMDETVENMQVDYFDILKVLMEEAEIWNEEYQAWAHSVRGILDTVQQFSGDIVNAAAGRLTETAKETGVTELLKTTEKWNMNGVDPGTIDPNTLFDKVTEE